MSFSLPSALPLFDDRGHLTHPSKIGKNAHMRLKFLILASILLSACASAQDPKAYLSGKLLDVNSVPCGVDKGQSNHAAGTGVDAAGQATTQALCPEYVLATDDVTYRIISRNTKHPAPLPVGEDVRFRLQNGKMHLRVLALDNKEREYMVLSMTPRGESAADAAPIHLNHLQ